MRGGFLAWQIFAELTGSVVPNMRPLSDDIVLDGTCASWNICFRQRNDRLNVVGKTGCKPRPGWKRMTRASKLQEQYKSRSEHHMHDVTRQARVEDAPNQTKFCCNKRRLGIDYRSTCVIYEDISHVMHNHRIYGRSQWLEWLDYQVSNGAIIKGVVAGVI